MRTSVPDQLPIRGAGFLSSFDRFTIPPLLVPIHDDLGISLGTAAVVASAYFVAYGISQPFWGALSNRVGRTPLLRGAVMAGGLACVVAASAQSFALLVLARALSGIAFGAVMPTAITYTGDTVPLDQRQHALAVLTAFNTSGVACATVVAGVAAQLFSWRAAFLAPALVAALVAVALRRVPEPRREPVSGSFAERVAAIRGRRWVWVVVGIAFVEGAVLFGSLTFVAAALQKDGVGAAVAGSAAAGFGVANVICTPLVMRAIARYPSPLLMAGGATLISAGLACAAIDTSVLTAIVATFALGAGFGFMHTTVQTWATDVYPAERAIVVSLFACALFTGGAVVSAVAAPLVDDGRFSLIFLLGAAGAAILAVVGPLLRARYLASPEAPHAESVAVTGYP